MVRRKRYITIIYILGIFTGLIVFVNVMHNTFTRYDNIVDNVSIGADLKITFSTLISPNNTNEINQLENNLLTIKTNEDQSLINNVTTIYEEKTDNVDILMYYLNFSNYFETINDANKRFAGNQFKSKMKKVISESSVSSDEEYVAIVSESVLTYNQMEVGDSFAIDHYYYNSSGILNYEEIKIKIIEVIDILPGIYYYYTEKWNEEEYIAIDIKALNQSGNLLHSENPFQLIDLNMNENLDNGKIRSYISNNTEEIVTYLDYQFYNPLWNNIQQNYAVGTASIDNYAIFNLVLLLMSVELAVALSIIMLHLLKDNKYMNGLLLAIGFGKKNILKFMVSQLFIIYVISIFSGLCGGLLTSIFLVNNMSQVVPQWKGLALPIYSNGLDVFFVLIVIIGLSTIVFLISYLFEMRKSITQFLYRF